MRLIHNQTSDFPGIDCSAIQIIVQHLRRDKKASLVPPLLVALAGVGAARHLRDFRVGDAHHIVASLHLLRNQRLRRSKEDNLLQLSLLNRQQKSNSKTNLALWMPRIKIVHHDRRHKRFSEPSWQTHQRVGSQARLDHLVLIISPRKVRRLGPQPMRIHSRQTLLLVVFCFFHLESHFREPVTGKKEISNARSDLSIQRRCCRQSCH